MIYIDSDNLSIPNTSKNVSGLSINDYKNWIYPSDISSGDITASPSYWKPQYYNYDWYMVQYAKDILIIYDIIEICNINNNSIMIKYKALNDNIFIKEYDYGSIYLYPSCTVSTFTKGNWQYWKNCVISELEPTTKFKDIKHDTKFVLLNQFDNEITNEELINCVKDKDFYYSFIHNQLNKNLNNENIDTKCNIHHKLDELLKL